MWPLALAASVFILLEAAALGFLLASVRRRDRDGIYMSLVAIEFGPLLFLLSPGSPFALLLPQAIGDAIDVICAVSIVATVALFIVRHPARRSRE